MKPAPRLAALSTAALSSAAVLVACTSPAPTVSPVSSTSASVATSTAPAASPGSGSTTGATANPSSPTAGAGLEQFYSQTLQWSPCDAAECSTLRVPVDYANPSGPTIEVAVVRVRSTGQDRIGSLVVNPGGPGGSGVDYAKNQLWGDFVVSKAVMKRYDLVGFDPRGVARSAPVVCLEGAQMDEFLAQDPTPDSTAEAQRALELSRAFAAACTQRDSNGLLGHVSTIDAAKDLDVLRAALGDDKLYYLGKSYGTYLGAVYAELFPTRTGRLVLDGAIAPDLGDGEMALGQALGFERATTAYLEHCVAEGNCPLGDDVDAARRGLVDLFSRLDATPVPVDDDPRVTQLTEGWAVLGVGLAMYEQTLWPGLTDALRDAQNGDGSALMDNAEMYADRSADGDYGNILQALPAVNCLDRPSTDTVEVVQRRAEEMAKQAPVWGRMLAWGELQCTVWPAQSDSGGPRRIAASGSAPILVVGTTRDPATPYEWAVDLAEQLEAGRLLTYDGDGHTAYRRSNTCVDEAVDRYLLDGAVPEEGTSC